MNDQSGLAFAPEERLKIKLLTHGVAITPEAKHLIAEANAGRGLSTADYASTSGVILRLPDDNWVNAPTEEHNPNIVQASDHLLGVEDGRLTIRSPLGAFPVEAWLQPAWHSEVGADGLPLKRLGVMHTDRLRISPIEGCAYTCTFCDLPYEFRYRSKRIEDLVALTRTALSDPVQPAAHVLISGGTPRPEDYGYVRETYEAILTEFPGVPVDIMMVPLHEVLDIPALAQLGLREVSINLEVWDLAVARRVMPRKHKQGRQHYLDFLAEGARVLGGEHVRSMLMLGIEPLESTLEAVEAIAELGCVPVLSPFRADPITPLRGWPVPGVDLLLEAYERAWAICQRHGVPLGPPCRPCAHNTLSFPAAGGRGSAHLAYGSPRMVSGVGQ